MALIRKKVAFGLLGVSKQTFENLAKSDPTFPRPIKLGEHRQSIVLFDEGELHTWVQALKDRRDMLAAHGSGRTGRTGHMPQGVTA